MAANVLSSFQNRVLDEIPSLLQGSSNGKSDLRISECQQPNLVDVQQKRTILLRLSIKE
jgi:hypothetical protein